MDPIDFQTKVETDQWISLKKQHEVREAICEENIQLPTPSPPLPFPPPPPHPSLLIKIPDGADVEWPKLSDIFPVFEKI